MENKNLILFIFVISSLAFAQSPEEKISSHLNYWILVCYCLIMFIIAGIVALIIILSGVKLFTNEDMYEREEAKKRIKYAIVVLIFILIACPLVNFLIEGGDVKEFKCECLSVIGGRGGGIDTTTTTLRGGITTRTTTKRVTTTSLITTLIKSTTTTTFEGGGIRCVEECINGLRDEYKDWKCRKECKDDEIDFGAADDCSYEEICCCIKLSTTTTTSTGTTTTTYFPPPPPPPPI
ncbi:MAG: pilin [Candidatus Altiarchaeota archaeon]